MKARATIRIKLPSEHKLETILKSLEPEVTSLTGTRSRANLVKEQGFLTMKIEAKDTVALRASLNAYLRWINAILNVFQTIESQEA
jgi:KEOPS complex subunit Pcc1